jgi:hypothetical protein
MGSGPPSSCTWTVATWPTPTCAYTGCAPLALPIRRDLYRVTDADCAGADDLTADGQAKWVIAALAASSPRDRRISADNSGRSGRQCPGVVSACVRHHQMDLSTRDAMGHGGIGQ